MSSPFGAPVAPGRRDSAARGPWPSPVFGRPADRPRPRSSRPGCSASIRPNSSTVDSAVRWPSWTAPEPIRIVEVAAAVSASSDGRGGAGHPRIEVMLGEPVPGVAEPLGGLGQVDAVAQRLRGGRTRADRHQVEHGERGAGHDAASATAWPPAAARGPGARAAYAFVLGAEHAALLQQRHDRVGELVQAARGDVRHQDEPVAGVGLDELVDRVRPPWPARRRTTAGRSPR